MKKIYYMKDTKKFWKAHKESRSTIDRDIASRPIAERKVIEAKKRANHTAMRNAKKIA